MNRFFQLDNPVWRFVGNLADMFLLSVYWYLCCIPVITIGCGTTALYYCTLKLTSNQEGYTTASFIKSFKNNFKQATAIWLLCLLIGIILAIDLIWALSSGSSFGASLLPAFLILILIYFCFLSFLFPLLARCENSSKTLMMMSFSLSLKNFLPVLSTIIVTVSLFSLGLFVAWPLLLIAPGLSAYLNSYIYNRLFNKYNLSLTNDETGVTT